MSAFTDLDLEGILTHWRKEADFVERGEMRYLFRGLYEDYMSSVAALAAVLTRYADLEELLASWQSHALRGAVEHLCVLPPGRGVLHPDVLEGAAYWRRFRQLIASATSE
jgi:hypothetical protein